MTNNAETVLGMYEAFGRGDVAHILDRLSDDIAWDDGIRSTSVSYIQPGRGKGHVTAFFQALGETIDFLRFEPSEPCVSADGRTVMVAVTEEMTNKVTGAKLPVHAMVHHWTFGLDGKATAFVHIGDFAIHETAAAARVAVAQ